MKKVLFKIPLIMLFLAFVLSGCQRRDAGAEDGWDEAWFTDLAAGREPQQIAQTDTESVFLLDLGGVQQAGCLRIRRDRSTGGICRCRIEAYVGAETEPEKIAAEDAAFFTALFTPEEALYTAEEVAVLQESVQTGWLRISVEGTDVCPAVSVYAEDPRAQVFARLQPHFEDGRLCTAEIPEWLSAEYVGCRPYAVLDEEGRITDLLEDKQVHVGFRVTYGDWVMESPDYVLTAEASDHPEGGAERPAVIPELQEWRAKEGTVCVSAHSTIYAPEALQPLAEQLAADVSDLAGWEWKVCPQGTPAPGDIVLNLQAEESLGEEGYRIRLDDTAELSACTETGAQWAEKTLLQMLLLYGEPGTEEAEEELSQAFSAGPYTGVWHLDPEVLPVQRIASEQVLLPAGDIRDYPSYPVRGFEIDVARNSVSLHMLREMTATLSWYKVNEITLHLNDNAILAYTEKRDSWDTVFDIYSAYRLESGITGSNGRRLTAADMWYAKDDFAAFVRQAAGLGVRVVPEIDTPAHSLALTSAFPELSIPSKEAADMLDLSREESIRLAEEIWDDALPAFADCPVVHLGGDEYYGEPQEYIDYEDHMLERLAAEGKRLRLWGSLSRIRGDGFVTPGEGLELLVWNTDWADPAVMYREGFALINAWNRQLYLIPGGGYDYADRESVYLDFRPEIFYREDGSGSIELPAWSDRIRGAQLCMWNDLCDELAIGITEQDMFDRLYHVLPAYAAKCWNAEPAMTYDALKESAERTGLAPGTDPYDRRLSKDEAQLLGPPYRLEMTLEAAAESGDTAEENDVVIWGEAEREGNQYILYLRNQNGRMGIACEEYAYEWDYALPAEGLVQLTLTGEQDRISLCVDGQPEMTIGSAEPFTEHATFLLPLETE